MRSKYDKYSQTLFYKFRKKLLLKTMLQCCLCDVHNVVAILSMLLCKSAIDDNEVCFQPKPPRDLAHLRKMQRLEYNSSQIYTPQYWLCLEL